MAATRLLPAERAEQSGGVSGEGQGQERFEAQCAGQDGKGLYGCVHARGPLSGAPFLGISVCTTGDGVLPKLLQQRWR